METNEKLVEVLNDLIQINNDRITGYEKAATNVETIDIDLKAIFKRMGDDSRKYASELTEEVSRLGGEPSTDTTTLGKIYRVWMDVKASFSGNDRQTTLDSCEYGEDAAQKAYRDAISSDASMDADTRQLISKQQTELKASHDLVKKLRDAHKEVHA